MATQILSRKERGDRIASEDIIEINSQSNFVKSQTGRSGYSVTQAGKSWACDCPDFRFHKLPCKHVYAVQNALNQQRINSRYKLGLWGAE